MKKLTEINTFIFLIRLRFQLGTVVIWTLQSLHKGSHEITFTVPLFAMNKFSVIFYLALGIQSGPPPPHCSKISRFFSRNRFMKVFVNMHKLIISLFREQHLTTIKKLKIKIGAPPETKRSGRRPGPRSRTIRSSSNPFPFQCGSATEESENS